MEYLCFKNFYGTVEISTQDNVFHGKIAHINDLVTYEADSIKLLKKEFEFAVEDYLGLLKDLKK